MGIIKRLFGMPQVIDAVIKGGDAAWFTAEERSQAGQKYLEWWGKYIDSTHSFNIVRRFIAVWVTGLWSLLLLTCTVLRIFEEVEAAKFVFEAWNETNPYFGGVMFLYFAHRPALALANGKK